MGSPVPPDAFRRARLLALASRFPDHRLVQRRSKGQLLSLARVVSAQQVAAALDALPQIDGIIVERDQRDPARLNVRLSPDATAGIASGLKSFRKSHTL